MGVENDKKDFDLAYFNPAHYIMILIKAWL